MPRSVNVLSRRVLPKLAARHIKRDIKPSARNGPRLYNGKRLIKSSQSAFWKQSDSKSEHGNLKEQLSKSINDETQDKFWRMHVSRDVADFVDDMEAQGTKLLPEEKFAVLTDPVKYFSRPQNVPNILRKQVYFPNFTVTLLRSSPGPYYAKFNVPMWFSKLDMKGYLKQAYNVDVVHVRSLVAGGRIYRTNSTTSRGRAARGARLKFMTVQLVKPFRWPVHDKDLDLSRFQRAKTQRVVEAQQEDAKLTNDYFKARVDHRHRRSIADQAQDILTGKQKWAPTWQQMPGERQIPAKL